MKKNSVLALALVVLSTGTWAQTGAKSVYAELGGPGIVSLNYDMRFTKKQGGLGMRVGGGGFYVDGDGLFLLPVGINYLFGNEGNKHFFELGATLTPLIVSESFGGGDGLFSSTFGTLTLGYRMQPAKSGFTFRASLNPVIDRNTFWPLYGGVSFGYKF
jgi:hypothetical protein